MLSDITKRYRKKKSRMLIGSSDRMLQLLFDFVILQYKMSLNGPLYLVTQIPEFDR